MTTRPSAIGFDYGTSNCAMGRLINDTVELIPLQRDGGFYTPSALYALEREFICESVARVIQTPQVQEQFIAQRGHQLTASLQKRNETGLKADDQTLFFGQDAINHYIDNPEEGYFIKSPKSFLGATGLAPDALAFFEDVITAMMQQMKNRAELHLQHSLRETVIGRPVNFQGAKASESNTQAIDILTIAAQRAGFEHIDFMYEPIAAGLAFEQTLETDKLVLVVDIGGGTSDCAMLQMGPNYSGRFNREPDFIGHAGERIGGNDLDIQVAYRYLMPAFGLGTTLKNGLPAPTQPFWQAVAINDVGAQAQFYTPATRRELSQFRRDSRQPDLFDRFIQMYDEKLNYQVVRSAELTKIQLSTQTNASGMLDFVESDLAIDITQKQLEASIERLLDKITDLMSEAIAQATALPDCIFITGGGAKSPAVRKAICHKIGNIPVYDGDDFGSVAAGLSRWADLLYR